ncbi:MAG TPA: glycosyltransferase family 2 protein [Thermodesulfobacteriota bacterium]|jgi:glycosyltransferase|nr:glycosyltransferase family 2 protein [Thermodesulfobacteriota bacterium]
MRISVITAVFNSRGYIGDCIRSVLEQSYGNLEHIVVDGGSTDGTLEVVRGYGDRISRLVSEPDGGIYDAMNKGIGMATGDVIGFLHSDDFYADRGVIERVAKAFRSHRVESVYGDLVYVNRDGSRVIRYWRAGKYREGLIRFGWMPPHPTFFVKREVYERYGCFNTSLRIAADYELVLRFLGRQRITTHYIPEVLVKMRVGGVSNGNIRNVIRKTVEDYRAMRINGLNGAIITLFFKNLLKIPQFFMR